MDDGDNRFGRPQKQAMQGQYDLPDSRLEEFMKFDDQVPLEQKNFVLNKMKDFRVR